MQCQFTSSCNECTTIDDKWPLCNETGVKIKEQVLSMASGYLVGMAFDSREGKNALLDSS